MGGCRRRCAIEDILFDCLRRVLIIVLGDKVWAVMAYLLAIHDATEACSSRPYRSCVGGFLDEAQRR